MDTKVKKREWVKSATIIFLSILLVLTFFSNTIMNRSLPEVAAQYVESGSINARIRGSGQVSANEVYEITLSQSRKIQSVLVKVGQEILAGDPLFMLESMDSEELKAAKDLLEEMELNYQKNLILASNESNTEDRGIMKYREAYERALATYRMFSNQDPDMIVKELEAAKIALKSKQAEAAEAQRDLEEKQAEVQSVTSEIEEIEQELTDIQTEIAALQPLYDAFRRDLLIYEDDYLRLLKYADHDVVTMSAMAENAAYMQSVLSAFPETEVLQTDLTDNGMKQLAAAFDTLDAHFRNLSDYLVIDEKSWQDPSLFAVAIEGQITNLESRRSMISQHIASYPSRSEMDRILDVYEQNVQALLAEAEEQQLIVDQYTSASGAAEALKAAEEALEDAVFQSTLGSTQALDLQAEAKAIEKQRQLVDQLTLEADGQEIVASVSGIVSAIHVTAGNQAGADQPIAEITVADRGYTVPVTVTTEQARQVRVGDTAEITNYYWGDIYATLENIANDPQSMGRNKILIFRIEGDGVEAGTNLTLSIGQKSANYDCLVPNSAIRTDSNGTFVLAVEAKSSPLGNRYYAVRADVEVLASDDTTSAVSGLSNGDFIITTSTAPLEAGDMVRLPDKG